MNETDQAYYERNQLVAALARLFPSGITKTAIEGWDPAWHNCIFIDLPTGQVSWHFHDREAYLFAGLPEYTQPWDGHSTPEKYRRVAALGGWRRCSCASLTTPDPECATHGARK